MINKRKFTVLIIESILLFLGVPSIICMIDIPDYYPNAIKQSKGISTEKAVNSDSLYTFDLPDKINVEFEKSISTCIDITKRGILLDSLAVEILDSNCTTPPCGYLAFAKAVRGRLSNGDTLVFISVCPGDMMAKDNELAAQFGPGEYIQYVNDELPEFSVTISGCELTDDLRNILL